MIDDESGSASELVPTCCGLGMVVERETGNLRCTFCGHVVVAPALQVLVPSEPPLSMDPTATFDLGVPLTSKQACRAPDDSEETFLRLSEANHSA